MSHVGSCFELLYLSWVEVCVQGNRVYLKWHSLPLLWGTGLLRWWPRHKSTLGFLHYLALWKKTLTVLLVALLAGVESAGKIHTFHYLSTFLTQGHLTSCHSCIYTESLEFFLPTPLLQLSCQAQQSMNTQGPILASHPPWTVNGFVSPERFLFRYSCTSVFRNLTVLFDFLSY